MHALNLKCSLPCCLLSCSASFHLTLTGQVLESPAAGSVPPLGWRIGTGTGGVDVDLGHRPQGVLWRDCLVQGPHWVYNSKCVPGNPQLFTKYLQINKIMLNFSLMELYITTIYCKGKTVLVVFILTVLI